jgi:ABC-type transport system involved in multi-copper enzyme maturation permease subunit
MIWMTWRQHRKQALFTVIGLAVLAAVIVPTGLAMRNTMVSTGLDECVRLALDTDRCNTASRQFSNEYGSLAYVGILFVLLPLLIGLFWGAPLVAREVEHGTHRLVWTQGVSRRQWALVKFGFVGGATVAAAIVYGLGLSWWMTPLSHAGLSSRFTVLLFDMQGLVPVGYTLFAVALGIFVGTVWPKVLPAMAFTLVGFVGVRVALTVLARPNYLPASTRTYPVFGLTREPARDENDWILGIGVRNPDGTLVVPNGTIQCNQVEQGPGAPCGSEFGVEAGAYNWQLYQPAGRFWLFQGIETGIFVALAAVLLVLAARAVRRIA